MTRRPESQVDEEVVRAYRAHLRATTEGYTGDLEALLTEDFTLTHMSGYCEELTDEVLFGDVWLRLGRPNGADSITREKQGADMEVLKKVPTGKGPAQMFSGDVWFDVIARGEEPSRLRVNMVRFSPCARTAWHKHAVGQTVHVTEGVGLIQSRGGEVIVMKPGDTVYTAPGEWHWHGAAPEDFMIHLAMWDGVGPDGGEETTWGEHVTEGEYNGPREN